MKKKKLILNKCEIEECDICDPHLLELHHIIPRIEQNTTNNLMNIAILCCLHHRMIDNGRLKIISLFPSTRPPNWRTLVYILDGKKNIDIDEPYFEFQSKKFAIS